MLLWQLACKFWLAIAACNSRFLALAIATLCAWLSASAIALPLPALAPEAKKEASDLLAFCKLITAAFCSANAALVSLRFVKYSLAATLACFVPKATLFKLDFEADNKEFKFPTLLTRPSLSCWKFFINWAVCCIAKPKALVFV